MRLGPKSAMTADSRNSADKIVVGQTHDANAAVGESKRSEPGK